jgi:hypothetical protein
MNALGAGAARNALLVACVAGWFAACSGSSSSGEPPDPGHGAGGTSPDAAAGGAGAAGAGTDGGAGKDSGAAGDADSGSPQDGSAGSAGQDGSLEAAADGCIPEICDGKDNNCDGNTDEGDPGGGGACDTGQLGACKAGVQHCSAGALQCAPLNLPKVELCNGVDDDCDGTIDDGTVAGVGDLCVVPGQPQGTPCALSVSVCEAGKAVCKQTFFASAEVCNGTDDDCNGTVDDPAAVNNQPCDTGLAGICAQGTSSCFNAVASCSEVIHPGDQDERCNGKDDDCNGGVDEMDATPACAQTEPAAQSVQTWQCTQGSCAIGLCEAGRSDANGLVSDGCECDVALWAADCATASVVNVPLNTTPLTPVTRTGGIPSKGGRAWFKAVFGKPALGTPYHFKISLSDSHGGEYMMNVRTACDAFASCSDAPAGGNGAATWEAVTAYVPGLGCCSDQQNAGELLVEIFRANAVSSCTSFTVSFLNY